MRMIVKTQSEILVDKPIVIYGDITGEGIITIADYAKLRQVILENLSLEGAFFEAANITRKTDVGGTIADYAMLRQYILENTNILQ